MRYVTRIPRLHGGLKRLAGVAALALAACLNATLSVAQQPAARTSAAPPPGHVLIPAGQRMVVELSAVEREDILKNKQPRGKPQGISKQRELVIPV